MKMSKAFPLKMALYILVLFYLWLDLFIFHGPLSKKLKKTNPQSAESIAFAQQHGVAARVYYEPIYLTQVDFALEEHFWLQGKTRTDLESLSSEALYQQRELILKTLIDDHLLRVKVRYNQDRFPVSQEDIDIALKRFAGRFKSRTDLHKALAKQGWKGEKELRSRLAARIQRERYLEELISVEVGEKEALAWYQAHHQTIRLPKRRKIRHLFLSITDHSAHEGAHLAQQILQRINNKELSFAQAVNESSEDPFSKARQGSLGWVSPNRLPSELSEQIFSLPLQTLTLITSSLGWHLIEVLAERPPQDRSFEDCKEEIIAALNARNREQGLYRYLYQLRNAHAHHVDIFPKVLKRPLSHSSPPN